MSFSTEKEQLAKFTQDNVRVIKEILEDPVAHNILLVTLFKNSVVDIIF